MTNVKLQLKELKMELESRMEDVCFKAFGYAVDTTPEKLLILETLEKITEIRNSLLENADVFPSGLSKISSELDFSSTKEEIIKEIETLISEISTVLEHEIEVSLIDAEKVGFEAIYAHDIFTLHRNNVEIAQGYTKGTDILVLTSATEEVLKELSDSTKKVSIQVTDAMLAYVSSIQELSAQRDEQYKAGEDESGDETNNQIRQDGEELAYLIDKLIKDTKNIQKVKSLNTLSDWELFQYGSNKVNLSKNSIDLWGEDNAGGSFVLNLQEFRKALGSITKESIKMASENEYVETEGLIGLTAECTFYEFHEYCIDNLDFPKDASMNLEICDLVFEYTNKRSKELFGVDLAKKRNKSGYYAEDKNGEVLFVECESSSIAATANKALEDGVILIWRSFGGVDLSYDALQILKEIGLFTYDIIEDNRVFIDEHKGATASENLLYDKLNFLLEKESVNVLKGLTIPEEGILCYVWNKNQMILMEERLVTGYNDGGYLDFDAYQTKDTYYEFASVIDVEDESKIVGIEKVPVNGYYKVPREDFVREVAVGVYDGESNDDDIFFWCETKDEIVGDHGDFVITSIVLPNANAQLPTFGFYTDTNDGVKFISCENCSSQAEVEEYADTCLEDKDCLIDNWRSFSGISLNSDAFELLNKLGVCGYNEVTNENIAHSPSNDITDDKRKIYNQIQNIICPIEEETVDTFSQKDLIKDALDHQITMDVHSELSVHELVDEAVNALLEDDVYRSRFNESYVRSYGTKILNAIVEDNDLSAVNVRECDICVECGTVMLPDDECYEKHDGEALCAKCSTLCQSCDKYYVESEGIRDIDNSFSCFKCLKAINTEIHTDWEQVKEDQFAVGATMYNPEEKEYFTYTEYFDFKTREDSDRFIEAVKKITSADMRDLESLHMSILAEKKYPLSKKDALIKCLNGDFIQCESDPSDCIYYDNFFFDKNDDGINVVEKYTHENGEDDSPSKWRVVSKEEASRLIGSMDIIE